jgi:hypothetical protein
VVTLLLCHISGHHASLQKGVSVSVVN